MIDKLGEDKQFIEIINTGTKDKPYYEIKYLDRITGKVHIGYSSYKLDVLSEFIREDFILSRKGHWIKRDYWKPLPFDTDPLDWDNYDEKTHSEKISLWYCSECDANKGENKPVAKFCEDCGAEMVEPQESEV